jgi:diadenylate cyclase
MGVDVRFIIDCVLYGLGLIVLYYTFNRLFARSNIWKILVLIFVINVIAVYFNLTLLSLLCACLLIGSFIMVIVSNEERVVKLLRTSRKMKRFSEPTDNEKKMLYKAIDTTVAMLSTNKIGAIITFERNDSLEEYIKTGVRIDAPVRAELLTTIFYPGTTLHDGAVIIRDNTIEAASVFYTPSTKALKGKFGARHRASLGISEVCDAVTVIVSEETGRISFALDGELIAVSRENFLQAFKDLV